MSTSDRLATLEPQEAALIIGFMRSYLELDGKENLALKREMAKMEPEEAKRVLKLTNQWIEEGKAKGIKLGEKRGKAEGKAEELRKTVLNMHRMGSSLEFIASVTELPRARVERLIAEAASPSLRATLLAALKSMGYGSPTIVVRLGIAKTLDFEHHAYTMGKLCP